MMHFAVITKGVKIVESVPISILFSPRSMNIWNRLPCLAVSHVIPSVDNFHKFAIPAIRDMQPLYGAALI